MELITGATGYIGSRLLGRLADEGRPVRALARRPERVEAFPGVEPVAGDLISGRGLPAALDGVVTAYYLVHSMESSDDGSVDFAARDRRAAASFARAAVSAGLERVVYLGGIEPEGGASSPHLRSRLEVERILLDAVPASTALRASIVIGAESSSFRVLVRLVERLRVLPLPRWRENRTQPIAERDAIDFLARAPEVPGAAGRALDVAGPDVMTYAEMLEVIAEEMGVGRMPLGFGRSLTPPASAVVAAVSGEPVELVRPLMESLETDILARDAAEAWRLFGIRPLSFRRAVTRALREWEQHEPLGAR
ncbi:MAG TPA: NAD(P)H-binding protein [Thermoleophilaceae bacterium]|nr:NAD(P)H-binding protein [Thermoleophilaceae bacterium]